MDAVSEKMGTLSIDKENLFSIIKTWLYSDRDIFFRELISNGCDAITKRKYLIAQGEDEMPEGEPWRIDVILTPSEGTITFIDNGIGMTWDEVELYINQIAFSGVTAFTEKYATMQAGDQIIGHFGLGFYSAFIDAEVVSFETLSCKKGAAAVHWESDGSTGYYMSEGERRTPGTEITLYMRGEGMRFLNKNLAKQIIRKYCGYMPVEIWLTDTEEADTEAKEALYDESGKMTTPPIPARKAEGPLLLNQTEPFWKKNPDDCTDEEYLSFYHELFPDPYEPDPLFWIHLKTREPIQLDGVLYFPKLRDDTDSLDGVIKLYSNQVFVAENVKEVIPDYLMLLKGVIDCPEFPVNVSRSAMQSDAAVQAISSLIGQLVQNKLTELYQGDREVHAAIWEDINPVVKYGCLKSKNFRKAMMDLILYQTSEGSYMTLDEYLKGAKGKHENVVYYSDSRQQQIQYIELLQEENITVLYMEHLIDQPFIQNLETWKRGVSFRRVDSDVSEILRVRLSPEEEAQFAGVSRELTEMFRTISDKRNLIVRLERYKLDSISSLLSYEEESRRLQDMIRTFNIKTASFGDQTKGYEQEILTLNANNRLVQYIMYDRESELSQLISAQLYDLACLSYDTASFDRSATFVERTGQIMERLLQKEK